MDGQAQIESTAPPVSPEPKTPKTRKRRITKVGLSREVERQMLENAKEALEQKWLAVMRAMKKDERWACELVASLFEGYKGLGGVNIVSQTLNMNGGTQDPSVRSLESIVRKLEVKDNLRAMPEPTPVKRLDQDVIDIE